MAYKKGDRSQMTLLPASVEDYVSLADPVRAYDAIINTIDLKSLGMNFSEHKVGNGKDISSSSPQFVFFCWS